MLRLPFWSLALEHNKAGAHTLSIDANAAAAGVSVADFVPGLWLWQCCSMPQQPCCGCVAPDYLCLRWSQAVASMKQCSCTDGF